jgi:SET domain-containing protein
MARKKDAPAVTPKPARSRAPEAPVQVRRSRIQGRGVFATRDIGRGERIMEYTGERISHEEASERYDDETMRRHHTFLFTVDDEVVIDGARFGNDARYINHSCAPNAYSVVARKRVYIHALKKIRAGEEILYDYWYSIDPGYTLEELRRLYPCHCGAPKCRGTLAGVKLPRPKKAKVEASADARADVPADAGAQGGTDAQAEAPAPTP